jgi:hypothetical protein
MGPQQVLRAALLVAVVATTAQAAPRLGDRVAVIDLGTPSESGRLQLGLGPADEKVRQKLEAAIVAASHDPLLGDGVEDALAGINPDRDTGPLAAALLDAQSKFGALACGDAIASAQTAIAIGAGRQASGLAVPELARAWTYVLLCADRGGDARAAQVAATHLRTLGGSPDVDASVLARYPEIDALSNREAIELEIKPDVDGADVFVDFRRVGKGPMKLVVTAGTHWIAAGSGTRRGMLTGTVVKKQPSVTVPMPDQAGPWATLAEKIVSWKGTLPAARELESVMNEVGARVALVRHGSTVEAWGHAGRGEPLRRLGNDDGIRPLAEAPALVALVADRIATWNDRAPDPDQPLLVETPEERRRNGHKGKGENGDEDEPTKWWVYATIGGALLTGALIIYANNSADAAQRVELHYP